MEKLIRVAGEISVGVTWIDGGFIFPQDEKWSQAFYGICHYSEGIFAFAPIDYEKVTMLTTIYVSPKFNYCDRADTCVYFDCICNRFKRDEFVKMFKDAGAFTLGLPQDIGRKPLWFNEGIYIKKWKYFIIPQTGGTLMHKNNMKE